MRLWQREWSMWKPILPPLLLVAVKPLTGTDIRLKRRNPDQLGLAMMELQECVRALSDGVPSQREGNANGIPPQNELRAREKNMLPFGLLFLDLIAGKRDRSISRFR